MSRTHDISNILGNVMDLWHLQYTDLLQVLYSKFNTDISLTDFWSGNVTIFPVCCALRNWLHVGSLFHLSFLVMLNFQWTFTILAKISISKCQFVFSLFSTLSKNNLAYHFANKSTYFSQNCHQIQIFCGRACPQTPLESSYFAFCKVWFAPCTVNSTCVPP